MYKELTKKELEKSINIFEEVLGKKIKKIHLLEGLENLKEQRKDLINPQLNDHEYNTSVGIDLEEDWIMKELKDYKDVKITKKDIDRYKKLLNFKLQLNKIERERLENQQEMNSIFGEDIVERVKNE
jgi:hypothetical protein